STDPPVRLRTTNDRERRARLETSPDGKPALRVRLGDPFPECEPSLTEHADDRQDRHTRERCPAVVADHAHGDVALWQHDPDFLVALSLDPLSLRRQIVLF